MLFARHKVDSNKSSLLRVSSYSYSATLPSGSIEEGRENARPLKWLGENYVRGNKTRAYFFNLRFIFLFSVLDKLSIPFTAGPSQSPLIMEADDDEDGSESPTA